MVQENRRRKLEMGETTERVDNSTPLTCTVRSSQWKHERLRLSTSRLLLNCQVNVWSFCFQKNVGGSPFSSSTVKRSTVGGEARERVATKPPSRSRRRCKRNTRMDVPVHSGWNSSSVDLLLIWGSREGIRPATLHNPSSAYTRCQCIYH